MTKKQFRLSILLVGISFILFIGLTIVGKIYSFNELPLQFMGALLGAVITAFITMILLIGQSQSEELKERNVKVFEEKTQRYNRFIKELWKIWEDKEIELEELKELTKLVTQDIVPYTNKNTVLEILKALNKISDNHGNQEDYKVIRKRNQQCIYDILQLLSKEIGLGGDITNEIQIEIDKLEDKILPVLYTQEFKKVYLNKLNQKLNNSKIPIDTTYFQESNNSYYIKLKDSQIEIELENFENKPEKYISFFIEYDKDSPYNPYRQSLRGDWKDYLKNPLKTDIIPSFKDLQLAEKLYKKENEIELMVENLIQNIEIFYNTPILNEKRIDDIIKECESN